MRTFFAVEIPSHIRKKVDRFIDQERKTGLPVKWVKFENLHITMKFLGEIDEKKKVEILPAMKALGKKFASFQVDLEGVGCFPNPRNPRVLWIGVQEGAEKLCEIASELEQQLSQFGFKEEKRFHPHLTIGRIKKFCEVGDVLKKNIKTESFQVNSITLFKSTLSSEGPTYEALEKFTFG